jgi:hypothetical protein
MQTKECKAGFKDVSTPTCQRHGRGSLSDSYGKPGYTESYGYKTCAIPAGATPLGPPGRCTGLGCLPQVAVVPLGATGGEDRTMDTFGQMIRNWWFAVLLTAALSLILLLVCRVRRKYLPLDVEKLELASADADNCEYGLRY